MGIQNRSLTPWTRKRERERGRGREREGERDKERGRERERERKRKRERERERERREGKSYIFYYLQVQHSLHLLFTSLIMIKLEFRWNQINQSYSHNWTTECMGPTPPRIPGSWFFLMSVSHSFTAYWITLSTPSRL